MALGADSLAEPVLAGASVLLLYQVVRRVMPDRTDLAFLASAFLGASTQFMVMSMTGFAMTSHLFFSVVWLRVYVERRWWSTLMLPLVGAAALGVHSPYPHVMFVAPFIFGLLLEGRWGPFLYVAASYSLILLLWAGTTDPGMVVGSVALAKPSTVTGLTGAILQRGRGDGITGAMSITLLATWSVPVAFVTMLMALMSWRRLSLFFRCLAISFIITVLGRAIFFPTQGAGWGSRYAFAVLGNFAILSAVGCDALREAIGHQRSRLLLTTAFASATLIQLPLRGLQAHQIVRPYREASEYLSRIKASIVIVPFDALRWGRQLQRNDPFLRNSPKLMNLSELTLGARDSLERLFPGGVQYVRREELTALGIRPTSRIGRFEIR